MKEAETLRLIYQRTQTILVFSTLDPTGYECIVEIVVLDTFSINQTSHAQNLANFSHFLAQDRSKNALIPEIFNLLKNL